MSEELISRFVAYPRMAGALATLPSKMLRVQTDVTVEVADTSISADALEQRVEQVVARLHRATFTGKGDQEQARPRPSP